MKVDWEELRPHLFATTNLSNRIIVFRRLDRNSNVINMSIENLGFGLRLDSDNFNQAKLEAVHKYEVLLNKFLDEIYGR